ncbi:major facilitator superfamily domain-containing protein [Halteromyces radiatus]|uniref:major facilitator superfamily domain-containing protein n=1 Tax=Halteromyces radiatus TaxID=101107 RepID=UPI00221FFF36|nr:major facilitator superfamily domain-containing protein [Halteromyces radiatus]KAI8097178.1 major facilitator superfamily domain-containing protein [Halteromyces radiatus]
MDQQSTETTVNYTSKSETSHFETRVHDNPNEHDDHKSASTIVLESSKMTFLSKVKIIFLYIGLFMSMLIVSLNTTVVAPAMGIIATDLHALDQQTWIATAYLLIFNAVQPISGKMSDIFGRKPVITFGVLMFFIGALINSLAQQMRILIAGRVVQGLGAGFIMSMAFIIITDLAPPHLRPRFQSLLTAVYGISSGVGVLIGGAFVDHLSWHWDFWLNVILSGVAFVLIVLLLNEPVKLEKSSFTEKLKRIDWYGAICSLGFVCCLLMALNWGPSYGWSDQHTIAAFVAAAVALIALVVVEGWIAKEPLMPARILKNPSVAILYLYMICLGLCFIATLYFAPVYYQSVFGAESMSSGIRLLPYMGCLIVASVGSSFVLTYFPYIKAYVVFGAAINVLGFGLFYTVNEHSNWGQQAGYMTFCGFCFGISQSNVILAVQLSSEKRDMAVATSLNNFFLILSSSVSVAIYQALFQLFLTAQLSTVDPSVLAVAGKYNALKNYLYIRNMPTDIQQPIIHAYNEALHNVFIIPLVASGLAFICILFMKNIRFQPRPVAPPATLSMHHQDEKSGLDEEKQPA